MLVTVSSPSASRLFAITAPKVSCRDLTIAHAVVREDDQLEAGGVELLVGDGVVGGRHADERGGLRAVPAVSELEDGFRIRTLVVDEDRLRTGGGVLLRALEVRILSEPLDQRLRAAITTKSESSRFSSAASILPQKVLERSSSSCMPS